MDEKTKAEYERKTCRNLIISLVFLSVTVIVQITTLILFIARSTQ